MANGENGRHHGIIQVETEQRSPLTRAVELSGRIADEVQDDLFSPRQRVAMWDFQLIDDIVHLQSSPLDTWQAMLTERDHDFMARVTVANQLQTTGDMDRAYAIAQLEKLRSYQYAAGDPRNWITWAESLMMRSLLGRDENRQAWIIQKTNQQIEAIESGRLPHYVDTFRTAISLKYYNDFRAMINGKRSDAEKIVSDNPHLFSGAHLADNARFSGLYTWVLVGAKVADATDYAHAQSGAFTRALWGGQMVHYADSLPHTVLSALGHASGVGLVVGSDREVFQDRLVPVIAGADKKGAGKKVQFLNRFGAVIKAMRGLYETVDDQYSLHKGNGARSAVIYPGANRGDLLLEPTQIVRVLDDRTKADAVVDILTKNGTTIAPVIAPEQLVQMGASRRRADELAHLYASLAPFQRVVVLAALPNQFYTQVNWADVLNGQAGSSTAMAARVIHAIDEVTEPGAITVTTKKRQKKTP